MRHVRIKLDFVIQYGEDLKSIPAGLVPDTFLEPICDALKKEGKAEFIFPDATMTVKLVRKPVV